MFFPNRAKAVLVVHVLLVDLVVKQNWKKMLLLFLCSPPAGAYLDITTLQQLIDISTVYRQYPCNERLVQTISESRGENARYTYV